MTQVLFTSESVSEGHPDKICDQISDAILDECLRQDPNSRVACECFIAGNHLIIGGEITTHAKIDYEQVARDVMRDIGYDDIKKGLDYRKCKIKVLVNNQSPDIALGVNNEGAGDQGIVFGFATNETDNYMPLAISLAHDIVKLASQLRKENKFKYANPDMKSQVTLDITEPSQPKINTILCSIQHDENYDSFEFEEFIRNEIVLQLVESYKLNKDFELLINPTGRFVIGGPQGDAGLTGRKVIVDTYGGYARHGGGAFSGKDGTKVDRSGAYMARYVAKNLVAAGLTQKCEIQISYAIGIKEPISIFIETFGTNLVNLDTIYQAVRETFDFSPLGIIRTLELNKPIFRRTATYGHFGRNHGVFPWERLDKVQILSSYIPNYLI